MKTLNKDENQSEIIEYFNAMVKSPMSIISWQTDSAGQKSICPIFIRAVDANEGSMTIENANASTFTFDENPIFFFHSEQKVIFKCSQLSQLETELKLDLPSEVKYISQEDVSALGNSLGLKEFDKFVEGHGLANTNAEMVMVEGEGRANNTDELELNHVGGKGLSNIDETQHMVLRTDEATDHLATKRAGSTSTDHIDMRTTSKASNEKLTTAWHVNIMSKSDAALFEQELSFVTLDEEDKIFEGKRTTPRAKPPEGKMVTVQVGDGSRAQSTHPLYDLSQGGFAFLVFSLDEFNKDETVLIKAFDTKKFDEPMAAKIMAIREADEMGIQYKVGCQFIIE